MPQGDSVQADQIQADRRQAGSAYKRAGVDIEAGHRAVQLMKDAVARTHTKDVLGGLGGFGGLFRADFAGMREPVLVASTDGVGTKTKVAARAGQLGGLGEDIVNHCVNDILVQGARPLFFLDYIAMSQLIPEQVADFVSGAARACERLGVALLGGETAEMPGVYAPGELDIVGTIVGVLDRGELVDGSRIKPGDVVIGLPSTGLHTNGYSLARTALDGLDWDAVHPALGRSLTEALLVPHREYVHAFQALREGGIEVHGMAHITGGGLIDNPPRIFPDGVGMVLHEGRWPVPPLFSLIVDSGGVSAHDAYHALNMGLGFLFIVPEAQAETALKLLAGAGETPYRVGEMVQGSGVQFEER